METDRLKTLADEFAAASAESAELRARLAAVRSKLKTLRPALQAEIVEAVKSGRKQAEISRVARYTPERVRQICREAGIAAPPD